MTPVEMDQAAGPPTLVPHDQASRALTEAVRDADRIEALRGELERAKLEIEITRARRPWWRSWNATAFGALLAAITPVTVAVRGYVEKQRELALAEMSQQDAIANRYLDRMKDANERRRMLRFVAYTSSSDDLRAWALSELPLVEREAELMESRAAELEQRTQEAYDRYISALEQSKSQPDILKARRDQWSDLKGRSDKARTDVPTSMLGGASGGVLLSELLETVARATDTCRDNPNKSVEECNKEWQAKLRRPPNATVIEDVRVLEQKAASGDIEAQRALSDLRRDYVLPSGS